MGSTRKIDWYDNKTVQQDWTKEADTLILQIWPPVSINEEDKNKNKKWNSQMWTLREDDRSNKLQQIVIVILLKVNLIGWFAWKVIRNPFG